MRSKYTKTLTVIVSKSWDLGEIFSFLVYFFNFPTSILSTGCFIIQKWINVVSKNVWVIQTCNPRWQNLPCHCRAQHPACLHQLRVIMLRVQQLAEVTICVELLSGSLSPGSSSWLGASLCWECQRRKGISGWLQRARPAGASGKTCLQLSFSVDWEGK